jgi:hypothetical protein
MGGRFGKKYAKLVRGSVYDLVALYIKLIIKHPVQPAESSALLKKFAEILNNGYTFQALLKEILITFKNRSTFPFQKYSRKVEGNLVTQGVMYYHKQLKIMNSLPSIVHDIDKGTLTSDNVEFYVEPVASYTMDDLLKYFYSKDMADKQEYNPKRMAGMFKHMIDKYGLDKLLFMIEASARMFAAEHKVFTLSDFDSYSSTASQYLEEIRNSCKYSGGENYVPKRRVLFS